MGRTQKRIPFRKSTWGAGDVEHAKQTAIADNGINCGRPDNPVVFAAYDGSSGRKLRRASAADKIKVYR